MDMLARVYEIKNERILFFKLMGTQGLLLLIKSKEFYLTLANVVNIFDALNQRGPITGPRNNSAQVLSITSSGNFFFEERYDFGTKIGTSKIDSN